MDAQQRASLEDFWRSANKPTVSQRESFAHHLGLDPKIVQAWFAERRTQAKARRQLDEMNAILALEQATSRSSTPAFERPSNLSRTSHNTSLAMSSSMSRNESADCSQAGSYAPSSSIEMGSFPLRSSSQTGQLFYGDSATPELSARSAPSDQTAKRILAISSMEDASSSTRSKAEPGLYAQQTSDSQWATVGFDGSLASLPEHNDKALRDFMPPMRSVDAPRARAPLKTISTAVSNRTLASKAPGLRRPALQRTHTCPAVVNAPGSKSLSIGSMSTTQSIRVRRRPKLSPLGIGMSRSQSSIGDDGGADRRLSSLELAPYPTTPLRRVSSSYGVTYAPSPLDPRFDLYTREPQSAATDSGFSFMFPPSPISPENGLVGLGVNQLGPSIPMSLLSDSTLAITREECSNVVGTPPLTPIHPAVEVSHFASIGSEMSNGLAPFDNNDSELPSAGMYFDDTDVLVQLGMV
ncbi:hypothetical protein PYCC9005_004702 [Savitreella phatthalungensis]